jgi:hypothetical protein
MKKVLKRILFGSGVREATIRFGAGRGIKMILDLDNQSQRLLGLYEREIHDAFKKYAKRSEIFVDIGASDGYYGLIYYKLNPSGTIFLCDSDYKFPPQQKSNFLRNSFSTDRVNSISKYVCDFTDEENVDLDSLLANVPGEVFFKIDVDGGELEVLKGMKKVLKSRKCNLIIETHSKQLEDDCIGFLGALGYHSTIITEAVWRFLVPETRPIDHNRWFKSEA